MQPLVLSGKAETVFALIALKARLENERISGQGTTDYEFTRGISR